MNVVLSAAGLLLAGSASARADDAAGSPSIGTGDDVALVPNGLTFGADARVEANGLLKYYRDVGGHGAWWGGGGAGVGVSALARFGGPPSMDPDRTVRWLDMETGVSDAIHFDGWSAAGGSTTLLENETSFVASVCFARGRLSGDGDTRGWRGTVFGVAWLPTYFYFAGSGAFGAQGRFNPAGLRATVDAGQVRWGSAARGQMLRFFLTWFPYVGPVPTAVSVGAGFVLY